jgi:hypothetical protein
MINFFLRHFTKGYKLDIYMKSGNVIRIDRVNDYAFNANSSGVTKIELTQDTVGRKLLVTTIDLSQIEAVVVVN